MTAAATARRLAQHQRQSLFMKRLAVCGQKSAGMSRELAILLRLIKRFRIQ